MNARSRIVLHADDLGMNAAINEGIMSGFVHGLLTSASIMANAPGFVDGVARWTWLNQEHLAGHLDSADRRRALGDDGDSAFDIGVHLNLTQGMPLTSGFPAECRDELGRFVGIGLMLRRLTLSSAGLRSAVAQELEAQIARVVDAGLRPTHLNGHHYVELIPALAEPIRALATRFQIPAVRTARETNVWLALRHHPAPAANVCLALVKSGLATRLRRNMQDHLAVADAFCGTAHAGRVTLDVLRESISNLRPGCTLEVGLHPGQAAQPTAAREVDAGWHDSIAHLRPVELAMVQSSRLFELLASENLQLGRIAWLRHPARIAS